MASIRCKACGKTYDYRKEGFCPKCGAYNRPPRQEWVDAEGTVHYAGQEKECYERKECHEAAARGFGSRKNSVPRAKRIKAVIDTMGFLGQLRIVPAQIYLCHFRQLRLLLPQKLSSKIRLRHITARQQIHAPASLASLK